MRKKVVIDQLQTDRVLFQTSRPVEDLLGRGTIRVYSSDIGKGVFTYYLLSEGNVIASRKMVSSK